MTRRQVIQATCVLIAVGAVPLLSQEMPDKGPRLRLRSRTIATSDRSSSYRVPGQSGRVHLIAQTDGNPLDISLLAERGVSVLGYLPDEGVAISVPADKDLSGLGLTWIGTLTAADRQGFADSQDDNPSFYVVQFYSDVEMGNARSAVLAEQAAIQDSPSLLATQLLVFGTRAQMVALSNQDMVVYIFPASDELAQGIPVTPCVSGNTAYGALLPIASGLSGGWSADSQGIANLTYSFGPLTSMIPSDMVRQLFVQATQQWTTLVKVAFVETLTRTGHRNVDLGFYTGDHGDQLPFDGPGGVLAHTFYPAPPNSEPIAGDMHMDAEESWSTGGSGTDFYSVALHELGHALGLGHTTGPLDVMYPFYRHNITFSQTDINAIQALYAARDTPQTPPAALPLVLTVQATPAVVYTETMPLAGTASGGQGTPRVTWTTDRGGLGTAQGSGNWTIQAIPLGVGRNTMTVRAQDDAGTAMTQTVVVNRVDTTPPPPPPPPPAMPQAPTILVTAPTSATLTTTARTVNIKGTAAHPSGIKSISWRLSTGASGAAQGTTLWDTGLVGLQIGVNTVTVDAVALDGGMASKVVQITVNSPAPPPPGDPGGGSDTVPPTLTIVSPSTTSFATGAATITIAGIATDNVGVSVVRWETAVSGGVCSGTTNWSSGAIPLFVGMNNIVIRAFDAAGNASWRSISVTRR